MSWDRVLPAPAGLHYETPQVRPSDLLDRKIMSDLPKSHGPLVYRQDAFKYADLRPHDIQQAHRQMAVLNKGEIPHQSDQMTPMSSVHSNVNLMARPSGAMASKEISRSSSSSGSASPVKSAKERDTFCLCQPDPKVPRPRNGELMQPAQLNEHGKCFLIGF